MRILVLDSRNGDDVSDLFVADPVHHTVERIPLNYSPEICYDSINNQILVAETELHGANPGEGARYWLKFHDGADLRLVRQVETPVRPMYAGFPNRSTRVVASPSGRYVYFQLLQCHPERLDVYRLLPGRFDRSTNRIETGAPPIDSCVVEFGPWGDDDALFFHLGCDIPNQVALVRFDSPDVTFVPIGEMASRTYSLRETCGSWLDRTDGTLYCITREGWIYAVRPGDAAAEPFFRLPLEQPRSVPLQHIHGGGDHLCVGVARDEVERSLSLVSEVWVLSIKERDVVRVIALDSPFINFVVDREARDLYGVHPYERSLWHVELASGRRRELARNIGVTPCEVQLIP